MSAPAHVAILLAAGASARLGWPKALVEIDGEPLIRRAARQLVATQPAALLVVTGEPLLGARIAAALAGIDTRRVACEDWATGMGASLASGLRAAGTLPVDGALVCPCDLLHLSAGRLVELLDAWRAAPARPAACRYDGVVGIPAVLPRAAFTSAAASGGDRGARDWLRAQAAVSVVDAPELALDLDHRGQARDLVPPRRAT
jgi:molybdenum cofactor cytidylyltransferase